MQKRSSKNTSVNTHHLPAIYHKVNWRHYACAADDYHVFDIGCGQLATQYMAYDKLKQFGIQKFYPWDPNHRCMISKTKTVIEMSKTNTNKVILCANVLNVIDDGSCKVNGFCKVVDGGTATASDTGYRVIQRVTDNIVKIVFR